MFIIILELAVGGGDLTFGKVTLLFFDEAVGGVLLGLGLGIFAYQMLTAIPDVTAALAK